MTRCNRVAYASSTSMCSSIHGFIYVYMYFYRISIIFDSDKDRLKIEIVLHS